MTEAAHAFIGVILHQQIAVGGSFEAEADSVTRIQVTCLHEQLIAFVHDILAMILWMTRQLPNGAVR